MENKNSKIKYLLYLLASFIFSSSACIFSINLDLIDKNLYIISRSINIYEVILLVIILEALVYNVFEKFMCTNFEESRTSVFDITLLYTGIFSLLGVVVEYLYFHDALYTIIGSVFMIVVLLGMFIFANIFSWIKRKIS